MSLRGEAVKHNRALIIGVGADLPMTVTDATGDRIHPQRCFPLQFRLR